MRIALASDWFLPRLGGIELQMRDLAIGLKARGHDVEIITPVPGPDSVDGIRVHRLGVPRLPGAGIVFTPEAFERLRQLLESGNYDLVHVHFGIIAPAAYGATAIAQSLGLPTAATFHSVLTNFEVPQWLLGGALGIREWRVKWSAVSSVVADSIRPLVGGQDVTILPNGIDPEWWKPTADCGLRTAESAIRAVSVMRLHPRKRPVALIDAMAEATRRLGPGRLHLEIIGDGGELGRLHRRIERRNLESVVTLSGWKSRVEVRASLHRADVFLMPSRLEAFGIAALEARCAGLPVIAMRQAGARDFLTPGHDGLLVGSDDELADAIVRLATQREELERMRAATRRLPAGFGWPEVLAMHERLYHDAAGR
jgi:glycosyltransferase involved in cell wall biosynthesis